MVDRFPISYPQFYSLEKGNRSTHHHYPAEASGLSVVTSASRHLSPAVSKDIPPPIQAQLQGTYQFWKPS